MISLAFSRFASSIAHATGKPYTFALAVLVILVWIITGPIFHYSDTWQLIINTGTTIITFLMVFLIQNAQNRDAKAIHLKLDELIRAVSDADNAMLNLDELDDEALAEIHARYTAMAQQAGQHIESRRGAGEGSP